MKKCTVCKELKEPKSFYSDCTRGDGLSYRCRSCAKVYRDKRRGKFNEYHKARRRRGEGLRSAYNITLQEYQVMLDKCEHRCMICDTHKSDCSDVKLFVDHCHKTNAVRGLLCRHCNSMLGFSRDSTKTLLRAATYLRRIR